MSRWRAIYQRHYWFLVLFALFVSFRLLAIPLLRPGGFIADFSDYNFYSLWGQTVPMGYTTFVNLWSVYPPLFAAMMFPAFELSSRIPPWVEPRLFFHLVFGCELLLFEAGNLILIYRLGGKLVSDEAQAADGHVSDGDIPPVAFPGALRAALLYALMFGPAYIMLSWFEAIPLFFLLLGLDLLLSTRRWSWIGSAIAAALGFLVKLTPIILVPIAVRWLGCRLSLEAARREWFNRTSPGNLLRPALYTLVFAGVVIGVGLPLAHFNVPMALSSFRVNNLRPPWQSVWALLDNYYGYGLVPVDMRNLQGLEAGDQWTTRLPWGLITAAFMAVYLWIYTRRYDWARVRTPIVLTAVSVIWLFLYSKGWSPQFLVWILAFLVLLLPSLRGVGIAIALTVVNFVESFVFLIMLPAEHWILVGTVLVRTALLILLAVEWTGQIWPHKATARLLQTAAAWGSWVVIGAALAGMLLGSPHIAQAYVGRRLAEHPCRPAIELLRDQGGESNKTIATSQIEVWSDFYPWLREAYSLHVLDGYDPNDRPAATVIEEKMANLATRGEFWWVEQPWFGQGATWSEAATAFFARPGVYLMDEQKLGDCRMARVLQLAPDAVLGSADTAGSPVTLHTATLGPAQVGKPLHLVLYWQADGPVAASYTVFTQLFDPRGNMVAQQDNLPAKGLAPTDTWNPAKLIRDPYTLAIPATAPKGTYQLHAGLYDAQGRRTFTMPDGTKADHLTLTVNVD